MNTTSIAVINGQTIQVSNDEQQLVPIKPICQALGVAYESQVNKIKEHPIFGSVISLRDTTGADGKTYQMLCLPMEYIFGWIFSINPNNVNEAAREPMIRYQCECNHALYEHFTKGMKKERELLEAENALLKERDEVTQNISYIKDETARLKSLLNDIDRKLVKIRDERHSQQQILFD